MGQLVFQANSGGQTNLVGQNTASTFNLNIPLANGTLVSTGDTATVTSAMISGPVTTAKGGTGLTSFTSGGAVYATSTSALTTGTLPTSAGGTGLTSFTANQVFYASSTSAFAQSTNLQFSGTDLTVYGITVGRGAGAVSTNTAVGSSALATNSSGTFNTGIGYYALQGNTTGSSNTGIGYGAGYQTTTGSSNTSVGQYALQANTTASNNTAIGYQALYTNSTGFENTAIGDQAMFSNTTGYYNVAVGRVAGYSSTTGILNTYIGRYAGYSMTTGSKNTILGGYSGNQGGLDIRTASNYVVLSDGDGNPRGIFDNNGVVYFDTVTSTATAGGTVILGPTATGGPKVVTGHATGTASGNEYAVYNYAGTTIGSISQSGTTAVLYNTTSDQRLKENIVDAPEFGSVIDSLQVRSFDWKTDNTHQRAGFIAQELVTVAPEAVHQPVNEEEMMAVDYSKLVPMLVKEIQSLRKRLAAAGIA